MKKTKILGLALAAAMVLGSTSVAMAAESDSQSQGYFFNKEYQLTGGMADTAKSPAETFSFVSADEKPVAGKASLYAVAGTSYNDTSDPDTITPIDQLKNLGTSLDDVKQIDIGDVSYTAGEAQNVIEGKPVTVTVPNADQYKSVGYYYYKFKEKEGNTAGVTYSKDECIVRVAVTNKETDSGLESLEIKDVRLFNSDMTTKKDSVLNSYSAGELEIVKTVTGNMGDKNKIFNVVVTFTAADNKMIKGPINISTTTDGLDNPTQASPEKGEASSITVNLKVKNGTSITCSNVPNGVNYVVKETTASGYEEPKYQLDDSEATSNAEGQKGTVQGGREDMVTIINRKNSQIDTGVFTSNLPYIIILAGAAAGLALFFAGKKRRVED